MNRNNSWSFEYQWKNHDTKYLTYGLSAHAELKKFFHDMRCKPKDLKNKKVLDAGCGSGRLTKNIARFARESYGVDMITLPKYDNVKFIQANIMNLPFRDDFFDYVYCEGVLHHTPNPKRAFMELARVNNDRLFVMLYSKRNIFMKLRKYFFTYKYPFFLIKFFAFFFALGLYVPMNLYKIMFKIKRKFSVKSLEFLIFDYLSPRYQSIHDFDEVKSWFQKAGYKKIIKISNKGTEILGIKSQITKELLKDN